MLKKMTPLQRNVILITSLVLIVIFSLTFVTNPIIEKENNIRDFTSSKEGTFVGTIKANYKEPIDNAVVLFASATMPGISIVYEPETKKLIAGSPEMTAENIALFDGKKHQIAYAFKKGNEQQLYYDGLQVAQSKFEWQPDHLTGMAIREKAYLSKSFESFEFS